MLSTLIDTILTRSTLTLSEAIGIDPGWGSISVWQSQSAEYSDNKVRILYAEEYPRPDYNEMLEQSLLALSDKFNPDKVCVDGSAGRLCPIS